VQGGITASLIDARNSDTCKPEHKPLIKTIEYATQDAEVLAVKTGDAQVFPQAESVTAYIAKTADNGNAFTSVPDLKGVDGTVYFAEGFGVLTSDHQLLTALQAAMQELVNNGTYQRILDNYGIGDEGLKHITINTLDPADLQSG
jgi:polar amino acid transport system substrate-binding protein